MFKNSNWQRRFSVDTWPCRLNWTIFTLALPLIGIDVFVIHNAGMKHQVADALSGLWTTGKDKRPLDVGLLFLAIDHIANANTSDTLKATVDKLNARNRHNSYILVPSKQIPGVGYTLGTNTALGDLFLFTFYSFFVRAFVHHFSTPCRNTMEYLSQLLKFPTWHFSFILLLCRMSRTADTKSIVI